MSEWIKCSDRLPGTNQQMVLVCNEENDPEVAWFIQHKDGYYFCIGWDNKQTWEPEYWFPLPDMPKKDEH